MCRTMHNASPRGGSLGVASSSLGSLRMRAGSSSPSSIDLIRTGSRGPRSCASRQSSASLDRRSKMPSSGSWSSTRSRRLRQAGPGGQLGTESALNLPASRAGSWRETCPIHRAGLGSSTCPPGGHEGSTSRVGRSAVTFHALPGAGRSLRSLGGIGDQLITPGRGRRLAGDASAASGKLPVLGHDDRVVATRTSRDDEPVGTRVDLLSPVVQMMAGGRHQRMSRTRVAAS